MATLNSTMFVWVMRVLELMKFDVGAISGGTKLGEPPMGLSDQDIDVELRDTLNEMFQDVLNLPIPSGTWKGTSTVGEVVKGLSDNLRPPFKTIDGLRSFCRGLVDRTLTGCGATADPVQGSAALTDCLNKKLRSTPFLPRPIELTDLDAARPIVLDRVLKRMLA